MPRTRDERRAFEMKARSREERKHKDWLDGLKKKDRDRLLGRLSKHRTQCSCEGCSKGYDKDKDIPSRMRADASMQEQINEVTE